MSKRHFLKHGQAWTFQKRYRALQNNHNSIFVSNRHGYFVDVNDINYWRNVLAKGACSI